MADKTLNERILDARAEQKLARKDGKAERIAKVERELDNLLTQVPRTTQPKETARHV